MLSMLKVTPAMAHLRRHNSNANDVHLYTISCRRLLLEGSLRTFIFIQERSHPLHGPFWSLGDIIPEQIYAVSMLPCPFWSLGDVIPEHIYVLVRYLREKCTLLNARRELLAVPALLLLLPSYVVITIMNSICKSTYVYECISLSIYIYIYVYIHIYIYI